MEIRIRNKRISPLYFVVGAIGLICGIAFILWSIKIQGLSNGFLRVEEKILSEREKFCVLVLSGSFLVLSVTILLKSLKNRKSFVLVVLIATFGVLLLDIGRIIQGSFYTRIFFPIMLLYCSILGIGKRINKFEIWNLLTTITAVVYGIMVVWHNKQLYSLNIMVLLLIVFPSILFWIGYIKKV